MATPRAYRCNSCCLAPDPWVNSRRSKAGYSSCTAGILDVAEAPQARTCAKIRRERDPDGMSSNCGCPQTCSSLPADSFLKLLHVDHGTLVSAFSNDLLAHHRSHGELHPALLDRSQFRPEANARSHGGGGAVINVHVRPYRVVPRIQHAKNKIPACSFHEADHPGSRKHARPLRAQKSDGVVVADSDGFFARGVNLVVRHSKLAGPASTPLM